MQVISLLTASFIANKDVELVKLTKRNLDSRDTAPLKEGIYNPVRPCLFRDSDLDDGFAPWDMLVLICLFDYFLALTLYRDFGQLSCKWKVMELALIEIAHLHRMFTLAYMYLKNVFTHKILQSFYYLPR